MNPSWNFLRGSARFAKLAGLTCILFMTTGCLMHTIPDPDTNCDFPVPVNHQKNGLNFTKINDKLCESFTFFCKTRVTRKAILVPAEIDVTGYKNIAFAEIGGNAGADFSAALMEQMVKNQDINIVDRTQLAGLLAEMQITQEDLFDPTNRAALGRLLPGALLVIGKVDYDYKEDIDHAVDSCLDAVAGMKPCTKSTRTGTASVRGQIHFTETETGRQVQVKRISASETDSTDTTLGSPPQLNRPSLNDKTVRKAADVVIRSIIPTKRDRTLFFFVHSAVKKLDRGIAEAKAGKLAKAKKYFAEAIADIESDPSIDQKALGAARWNLGVIEMYELKHDEAEKLFSGVEDVALGEFPTYKVRKANDCLRQKNEELGTMSGQKNIQRRELSSLRFNQTELCG
ncbi:MAG: hypothetical protein NPIRA05_04910 [Nitrospirales bacterium]|nr:MAG: hypothetical protein NPIRA05_04910 [Nitrospirales bacterium]